MVGLSEYILFSVRLEMWLDSWYWVPKTNPRLRDLLGRHRTQDTVVSVAIIYHSDRIPSKLNKEEGAGGIVGGNGKLGERQEPLPEDSWDVLTSPEREVRTHVKCQPSETLTGDPAWPRVFTGAGHIGTLFLALPHFQTLEGKTGSASTTLWCKLFGCSEPPVRNDPGSQAPAGAELASRPL